MQSASASVLSATLAILLSGLAIYLAAPGNGAFPALIWLAFAPWFASLRRLGVPGATLSGLLMGLAWVIPLQWSTFAAAVTASGAEESWHFIITLGFFLTYAAPFAVFGTVAGLLRRRFSVYPALYPLLQAALLSSLICLAWAPFPYTPAVGMVPWPSLLQLAAWGGEPLLLTALLWSNAALGFALRWQRPSLGQLLPVAPAALALLLLHGFGAWRIAAMDRAEAAGQGVRLSALPLQLDLPAFVSPRTLTRDRPGRPTSALELSLDALQRAPQCEVVVWPETPMEIERSADVCTQGGAFAQRLGLPLLMQCFRPLDTRHQVSAEFLRPGAEAVQWHGKSSLVPFYEAPFFSEGRLAPGSPGRVFDLDAQRRLIPALCYELHARAHLRESVLGGGNVVVHMASFTPFSRQPIDRSDQAMAQLRAVEFGVPILRAANRGPVGWIDAAGRLREMSPRFGRHAECVDLWSPDGSPTGFARISPIAAWLPGGLALLLAVSMGWLKRRAQRS